MALEAGTKLGPYEILSPLGAGGMGEVYLASDSKLDRKVAIKVLPETMTRDKERVARFEREAKLLASLDHPNIAAIHGFDDSDGTRFLVMEYVEGETFSSHLANGPVAVDEALEIGKQMAEALEAAHEKGVIHRDLKPGNIMIRPDGAVKVLDFGLAKAMSDEPSGGADANSPTITANYTRPGVVLGTAAYMSPEQARGRALDKRTDIWSFGILLFECLTGQRLFQGETANDSMGAIMHKDPEWSLLPPNTPPTIQLLLRRCLTKDRKRRLHDIADARIELENALVDPSSSSLGIASIVLGDKRTASKKIRALLPWAIAAAALLIGAVGVWRPRSDDAPLPEPIHLSFSAPKEFELHDYDLSPDGMSIVYSQSPVGENGEDYTELALQLRRLNEPIAVSMRGTEGGRDPVFSPSGRWIAYEEDEVLYRVGIDGNPPVEIARLEDFRWLECWINESELLISQGRGQLSGLNANDGSIRNLNNDGDQNDMVWTMIARATPLSDKVLTTTVDFSSGAMVRQLQLLSLDTGQEKDLFPNVWIGELTPSRHLLFTRDDALLGVRFDAERLEPVGEVISLLAGVARFKFTPNGILVYDSRTNWFDDKGSDIVRVSDEASAPTVLSTKRREYRGYSVSPDGRRIAAGVLDFDGGTPRIWMIDLETGVEQPLGLADLPALGPMWSPDGTRIAYSVLEPHSIQTAPIDGSTEPTQVIALDGSKERLWIGAWVDRTPALLVNRNNVGQRDTDIMQLSLDDGTLHPILETEATERIVGLSPDENILAYESDVSGDDHIYVQRIDFQKGLIGVRRRLVTPKPFVTTNWSPDGTSLLGMDRDQQIWSVAVSLEPELTISPPEKLLNVKPIDGLQYRSWTTSPDGKGHIFLRGDKREDLTHLHVVLNFQTLLERRLPSRQD